MQETYTYAEVNAVCKREKEEILELLVGNEVYRQLEDKTFLTDWDALYAACPWATAFQGRGFVCTWYNIYRHRQTPILVKAMQEGRLTGLLTLTKEPAGRVITGAGNREAGYQTWLAEATQGESFIKKALSKLIERFPACSIELVEIPPQAPLQWVEQDPQWRPRCVLAAFRRPLMDLKAPDAIRLISSNGIKSKVNRLNKLGEVRFERIQDWQTFASVLDELNDQFDFRKGAMRNITPYRDEPLKKELQLALFAQGLLYATVLKVNEEIIASILAVVSPGNWLNGTTNTHAPAYGKYSPGIVSFLLLAKHLYDEGVGVYDLTTGGHGYKERLANAHDQVYELRVGSRYSRRTRKLQEAIVEGVKQRLESIGIAPREFRNTLSRNVAKLRARLRAAKGAGVRQLLQTIADQCGAAPALRLYRVEPRAAETDAVVRQNSLSDLLCFVQRGELRSRWDFLEEAEKRLQSGERAFALVEAGRLLCCGWLPAAGQPTGLSLPAGAVLLQGLYCHRQGRHRLRAFLETVARQVEAPLYVASSQRSLCRYLQKSGFRPC